MSGELKDPGTCIFLIKQKKNVQLCLDVSALAPKRKDIHLGVSGRQKNATKHRSVCIFTYLQVCARTKPRYLYAIRRNLEMRSDKLTTEKETLWRLFVSTYCRVRWIKETLRERDNTSRAEACHHRQSDKQRVDFFVYLPFWLRQIYCIMLFISK